MGLKRFLILGLVFADLIIVIALVAFLGIGGFAKFFGYYLIGTIITTVALGLMKKIDIDKWRMQYVDNNFKLNFVRISLVPVIIIASMLLAGFFKSYLLPLSLLSGAISTIYMVYYCGDMLHFLMMMQEWLDTYVTDKIKGFRGR